MTLALNIKNKLINTLQDSAHAYLTIRVQAAHTNRNQASMVFRWYVIHLETVKLLCYAKAVTLIDRFNNVIPLLTLSKSIDVSIDVKKYNIHTSDQSSFAANF